MNLVDRQIWMWKVQRLIGRTQRVRKIEDQTHNLEEHQETGDKKMVKLKALNMCSYVLYPTAGRVQFRLGRKIWASTHKHVSGSNELIFGNQQQSQTVSPSAILSTGLWIRKNRTQIMMNLCLAYCTPLHAAQLCSTFIYVYFSK